MLIHESSFKDPGGSVITIKGEVFRVIKSSYQKEYEHLMVSGLFRELVDEQLLIDHTEVQDKSLQEEFGKDFFKVIKPQTVTISYPGEWCFSQLKDAALCTLKIQQIALRYKMILKDCSAYNIQFHHGRPVLIDTLSFRFYKPGEPWMAYRQFCEHFYGPLLLTAHIDARLSVLFTTFIDGIPLDIVSTLLPFRKKLSLSVFLHIVLHARSKSRYRNHDIHKPNLSFNADYLEQLTENLKTATEKVKWSQVTNWSQYYNQNVKDDYYKAKVELVSEFVGNAGCKKVLDFGANDGSISRHINKLGIEVISTDYDHASIERNYRIIKETGVKSILPLVIDATNPTPPYGWAHNERQSFSERISVDTILALALIHHLVIFYNIPFHKVAAYFLRLAANLIIEFVPKTDPMVKMLLQGKEDVYPFYTQSNFEAAFNEHFSLVKRITISGSERVLYHYQR